MPVRKRQINKIIIEYSKGSRYLKKVKSGESGRILLLYTKIAKTRKDQDKRKEGDYSQLYNQRVPIPLRAEIGISYH